MRRLLSCFIAFTVFAALPSVMVAADDDDTLNLSPVKKGADKAEPAPLPTIAPALPTAAPTAVPPELPTPAPTPKPAAPVAKVPQLQGVDVRATKDGVRVLIKAGGPIAGSAANLNNPDRVLIKISGATLAGSRLPKEKAVMRGAVKRVRLATKSGSELWAVVDLTEGVAFKTRQPSPNSFEVLLMTGAAEPAPAPAATPTAVAASRSTAEVPKVNLMLFDLNVIYQDKQYDRFPCANFIYNASDSFPLKRDFVSTLVFHNGYGAFVGNVRILDPQGQLVAQTETPFAFNLFNKLTDYMVELPWKVEFKDKGLYSLYLALNGADVLKQTFYVGHNTDTPPAE